MHTLDSHYNYVVNNPVMFVDPDGREIWIKLNDKEGEEVNLQYRDGKLYTTAGDEYQKSRKKNGKYKGSIGTFMNDIKKLTGKDYGRSLINKFAGSKDKHVVIKFTGSAKEVGHSAIAENWSSIIYGTNHDYGDVMTEDGVEKMPSFIKLGHELGHADDHLFGEGIDTELIDENHDATKAEYYGTYVKNRIREEQGLSLRTHYLTKDVTDAAGASTGSKEGLILLFDASKRMHIRRVKKKSKKKKQIDYFDHKFK